MNINKVQFSQINLALFCAVLLCAVMPFLQAKYFILADKFWLRSKLGESTLRWVSLMPAYERGSVCGKEA